MMVERPRETWRVGKSKRAQQKRDKKESLGVEMEQKEKKKQRNTTKKCKP